MLAIRMQRTGRKGHAMFRVIVQDSQRTPTSGKIVARLGSYDPHAKTVTLDKEKAGFYLEHGAQPSDRVAILLKKEGVKLPDWVKLPATAESKTRNPDKRRSTRPDEPKEEAAEEMPTEVSVETEQAEAPVTEEAPVEEAAPEAPAGSAKAEETTPADAAEEAPATESPEAEASSDETDDKPAKKDAKSDK